MADQPATSAPASTTPATAPEGAPPAAESTAPAAAAAPKKGAARHAEIREKLAAAPKETATETPAPATASTATDKPAETEKPKPAVGAVMRLTAENTKLKTELESLQGKLESFSKGETIDSLREKVKKDPAILFDIFGEDLDADEAKRLARINDAMLDRQDPARKADRERDERVAKLEKELEDERKGKAVLAQQDKDGRARAHTAKVLTEGHKTDDGALVIDPAKYPYVNHLTKSGEVDAHAGVMFATREMADDFREKNKRDPNDSEIIQMIGIAASEAEAYFSKRAKNWQLPSSEPPPAAAEPPTRKTPTTIGAGLGSRAPSPVDTSRLSKAERHERIRENLRRAQQNAN